MALSPGDPNSFSRPDLAIVTHIHLDLNVDFEKKIFDGSVILDVEKRNETDFLILDINGLAIASATSVPDGSKLNFSVGPEVKHHGSKFSIHLPETAIDGDKPKYKIKIEYKTSEGSAALQWLEPEQTSGGKLPYVFSQCQAILARCMLPCQDTPSVKTTYTAEIKAPAELMVLMSALKKDIIDLGNSTRLHKFDQPVVIPSYLIAIVVGALVSKQIGPRSKVWTEKELIDQAAYEFAETEKMIQSTEELCGPYVWGVYDLLVLPPSFPYGGMENPCLTFVTPTLLAGDRSLVDVVVHEITHSWTGNLVTNANPEHFWLNEGHTVFIERKVSGRMKGEKMRHFQTLEGLIEFKKELLALKEDNPATCLVPDTKGVDLDDYFNLTPYEKGQTLLFYLEQLLGGPEVFDKFLRCYIDTFKYKSLNTQQWKDYLYKYFSDKKNILDGVDWDAWFFKPGMFPVVPKYDTSIIDVCKSLVDKWTRDNQDPSSFNKTDIDNWFSKQKAVFLGELLLHEKILLVDQLKLMDEIYHFNSVKNCEIRLNWLLLCLKSQWEEKVNDALSFATSYGRLKYVRPIFQALYKWKEARQRAIDVYLAKKDQMMFVTRHMIGKDLHLE